LSLDDPRPTWAFAGYAADTERRIRWPHTCLDQLASPSWCPEDSELASAGYIDLNEIARMLSTPTDATGWSVADAARNRVELFGPDRDPDETDNQDGIEDARLLNTLIAGRR
jgi:hypothetical protein